MILRPICEEFCRIKFLNMFKIFATTLCQLATHARKLQITGDCFETALRPTRDVCRQLSQNSRSPVRLGLKKELSSQIGENFSGSVLNGGRVFFECFINNQIM